MTKIQTTQVGKAVLFTLDVETGKTYTDVFTEADEHYTGNLDPFHRAEALRNTTANDFPGAIQSIGCNERARVLMTVTRMRRMGFDDYTEVDALESIQS